MTIAPFASPSLLRSPNAQGPPARVGAAPLPRRPLRPRRTLRSLVKAALPKTEAEETTEKYGLEAGLWKVLTSKDEPPPGASTSSSDGEDGAAAAAAAASSSGAAPPPSKTEQAKALLARYGSAYLVTSISFALVSFAACYAAVSAGVDMAALLARFGLEVNSTSEKVGAAALAYAAHKALSPVRFPPTVALTPVVARWLGKDEDAPPAQQ